MGVKFRIDQATPGQGTDDRTRTDLIPGEVITFVAVDPAPGPGVTYQWELFDRVGSSSGLSASSGSSVTLPAQVSTLFGFQVEMRAYLNGQFVGSVQRIAACRSPNKQLRPPMFRESASGLAKLSARNPDASTDNEEQSDLAGTGEVAQNWRGYAQFLWELTLAVEASGSGGGEGDGDVVGPASATLNALSRFANTSGKLLRNSPVVVNDGGDLTTPGTINGRDVATDGTKLDGVQSGAQVNAVTTVFGRAGAVVAAVNDYAASKIGNDSSVSGSTVKAALEWLAAAIGGGGAVTTVFGRAGAVVAVVGDYAASLLNNDSSVSGTTIKDALNALLTALGTKFDGAGAGLTNTGTTINVGAHADGSIVVNANDLQVGALAADGQHGTRGGGNLHADVVTGGASGFMTGAQATKLAGIAAGAEVNAVTTVFGRAGAVVAVAGDYIASKVNNDSGVSGTTVKDALNTLSAAASGWQTAYDRNFTQDSNFTFADGSNSWNGLTWTGANIAAKADSVAVINGTGLVIDCNAQSTDWYYTSDNCAKIYIALATLIPNFDWGASELRISAQFETVGTTNYDLGGISVEKAFVANQNWTQKMYAGYTPSYVRFGQILMEGAEGVIQMPTANKVNRLYLRGLNYATYASRSTSAADSDPNSTVFDLHDYVVAGFWTPATAATSTSVAINSSPRLADLASVRLVIGAQTANTNNNCVLTVKRLRVDWR